MKTCYKTLFFILLNGSLLWGQSNSNAVFFSVEGEPFTLIIDGERINEKPQTKVKALNVASKFYYKIIFEDTDLGELSDFYRVNGYEEHTFKIEKHKVKRASLTDLPRPEPIMPPPPPQQSQPQVLFGVVIEDGKISTGNNSSCYVSDSDMQSALRTVNGGIGGTTKLNTAMAVIRTKRGCMTSEQIKQIVRAFSYDDDRLYLAKYGYDYTKDRSNYNTLIDVFSSTFKKAEFITFLRTR